MGPFAYLRVLRRRWPIVPAAVLVALIAAWFTTTVVPVRPPTVQYQATVVLLDTGGTAGNLETLAGLVTLDPVAERVADAMEFEGDPANLAARVNAVADPNTGFLRISASSTDPKEATALADGFARELLSFLRISKAKTAEAQAQSILGQIERLRRDLAALEAEMQTTSATEAESLRTEHDSKASELGFLEAQYDRVVAENVGSLGLQIIQEASPRPLATVGFRPPLSRVSRILFAAIIGLLAGVGLALLLDRVDPRIWTKETTEERFGFPVLAEIPVISPEERNAIVAASAPRSPAAEAFRHLAAELIWGWPGVGPAAERSGNGTVQGPRVILVTSPGPGEGKTTVVANLAVIMAEMSQKVMVLSCDLRHPTVHELFGIPNDHGLVDALASGNSGPVLDRHVQATTLEIPVVPSGPPPERPSELLGSEKMHTALNEARERAQIVLLDTSPILAAGDATYLVPGVDAVLVVARAGMTRADVAQRTGELLRRLGVPVMGVALNGTKEGAMPRRYGSYRQLADTLTDGNGRRRGFPHLARHFRGG